MTALANAYRALRWHAAAVVHMHRVYRSALLSVPSVRLRGLILLWAL